MESLHKALETCKAEGLANVLAIGTANPPYCFYQADYPDYYFELTKSQHMTELKDKFKRICEKSGIKKRYMHLTEDIIKDNPNIAIYKAPSLDSRQEILVPEVPKLGMEAALKAIKDWGQPITKITHLIFCTSTGINMPSADHEFVKLTGLRTSVQRLMIYNQGCFAGVTALRLAKDVAENHAGARILIVCSELSSMMSFHAPSETNLSMLVGSAIFGDGAASAIVGADPDTTINERPLFQIVSATQTITPDSENKIVGKILEMGMDYNLAKDIPMAIAKYTEQCLLALLEPFGTSAPAGNNNWNWNDFFCIVHGGGPSILKQVEESLGLAKDKLKGSWHVLSEYGNMWSPNVVLFGLDEMRKKSLEEGKPSTGEGLEWGLLLAFGPGLTLESLLLRSYGLDSAK
ncbi:hypothetical protein PTKIN_Ptkin01aG0012600 [Pterospermum kingtungense]